jgi:hypothetical protein
MYMPSKTSKQPLLQVNIIYNKANMFGLTRDATVLSELVRAAVPGRIGQVNLLDPREPPRPADIQFHLEFPVYSAVAWAPTNILLVNVEHYDPIAYNPYLPAFDQVWVRDKTAARTIREIVGPAHEGKVCCVQWSLGADAATEVGKKAAAAAAASLPDRKAAGFVAFLGGSETKAAATEAVLAAWRPADPKLRIYTTRADVGAKLIVAAAHVSSTVEVAIRELPADELQRLQKYHAAHLIVSCGEGFGYPAAEAEAAGAFALMTGLPVFKDYYGDEEVTGVGYLGVCDGAKRGVYEVNKDSLRSDLDRAFLRLYDYDADDVRVRQMIARNRWEESIVSAQGPVGRLVESVEEVNAGSGAGVPFHGTAMPRPGEVLPPVLTPEDCPSITVLTLTYNRRKFIDLPMFNLLTTDYPRAKIEWLVVEDSDDQEKAASDKILKFAADHPEITVSYLPLAKKTAIGDKRNAGIERATHDIIVMMDDDDFYPATSFRRRVAWLTKGAFGPGLVLKPRAVAATMLAMYDLMSGKSAVNVPPWALPLGARVSEASMAFYKSFWAERAFPSVNVAEGEAWLVGREGEVLEIPPQQIIVALSHDANLSSRKVPAEAPVSCFWGFDRDLLGFLHGLAGVKVEAGDTSVRA